MIRRPRKYETETIRLARSSVTGMENLKHGGEARFENTSAPVTIGRDCTSSVRFQSITEELETGNEPIETDRTR